MWTCSLKWKRRVAASPCQHRSVWEVAPGECCLTHKGEIQRLFQRKSSSLISTTLGKAKQRYERTVEPRVLAYKLRLPQFMRWKGSWQIYSSWRQESEASCVKTSPWRKITEMCLLGVDNVSDWCQSFSDSFIRWDLKLSCALWNKYSAPPSAASRNIDLIHLSWERWL